jgi:hypothetical protein
MPLCNQLGTLGRLADEGRLPLDQLLAAATKYVDRARNRQQPVRPGSEEPSVSPAVGREVRDRLLCVRPYLETHVVARLEGKAPDLAHVDRSRKNMAVHNFSESGLARSQQLRSGVCKGGGVTAIELIKAIRVLLVNAKNTQGVRAKHTLKVKVKKELRLQSPLDYVQEPRCSRSRVVTSPLVLARSFLGGHPLEKPAAHCWVVT